MNITTQEKNLQIYSEKYVNKFMRISVLLKYIYLLQVSHEVIKRCHSSISLEDIFTGHVDRSKVTLQECIDCCEAWKNTYNNTSRVHSKFSNEKWVLDNSSIFAQIDAFMQRCRDLLEVCEGQVHFARSSEGKKKPIPCFPGCRGPEIARSLREIEATFEKHLGNLKAVKKGILNVKNTRWHDDYNKFRAGIKDLEIMMQNVITSAFEVATTVQEGVELLDIFEQFNSREVCK